MANLQVRCGTDWQDYCREPVSTADEAAEKASRLVRRIGRDVRVVLQDWEASTNRDRVLGPFVAG